MHPDDVPQEGLRQKLIAKMAAEIFMRHEAVRGDPWSDSTTRARTFEKVKQHAIEAAKHFYRDWK